MYHNKPFPAKSFSRIAAMPSAGDGVLNGWIEGGPQIQLQDVTSRVITDNIYIYITPISIGLLPHLSVYFGRLLPINGQTYRPRGSG